MVEWHLLLERNVPCALSVLILIKNIILMALLISLGAWSSGTVTNNSEYSVELAWFMYLRKNLFLHIFDSLHHLHS